MKYTHKWNLDTGTKPQKMVDNDYDKKGRFVAKVGLFYSVAVLLIGIAIALIFNINRYDKCVGKPMNVDVAVYDVAELQVEEDQGGVIVSKTIYKPLGNCTYHGYSMDVTLGEGYVAREIAEAEVGTIQNVVIDSATLEEVDVKPFNYVGVVVIVIGFVSAFTFAMVWVYYSKWNADYTCKYFGARRIYS